MSDDDLSAARADAADAGLIAVTAQVDAAMDRLVQALAAAGSASLTQPDEAAMTAVATTADVAEMARSLAEVAGALALCGQPGLAMMANELRTRLLADFPAEPALLPSLQQHAARLRRLLAHALGLLLRGEPLSAGELLPAWQALINHLDGSEQGQEQDRQQDQQQDRSFILRAAELIVLDPDPSVMLSIPPLDDGCIDVADPQADAERALLNLLRATDETARSTAVNSLASLLATVIRVEPDSPACTGWQVLHACLLEMAAGAPLPQQRSKSLLAGIVRAMRHRPQPVPPSLLREALFGLAMNEAQTEAGRLVVRKFRLAQQFPPVLRPLPDECETGGSTALATALNLLDRWIAGREAAGDGVGSPDEWQALAAACARCAPLAAVVATMQSLSAHWADLQGDRDAHCRVAAWLCCLRAVAVTANADANAGRQDLVSLARLLESASSGDTVGWRSSLARCWQICDTPLLSDSLHRACIETLADSEHQFDAATDSPAMQAALGHARQSLQKIRGIAQLLAIPALPAQIDLLLSFLDEAAEGVDEFALQRLAPHWVALAYRLATLHGHGALPGGDPIPVRLHPTQHASSELLLVFFGEASRLIAQLRSLQPLPGAPDATHQDALHAVHTLAGCSATAGLNPMSRLALALERALHYQRRLAPALLDEALDTLERMLAQFATAGQCEDAQALIDRLEAGGYPADAGLVSTATEGIGLELLAIDAAEVAAPMPDHPAPAVDECDDGEPPGYPEPMIIGAESSLGLFPSLPSADVTVPEDASVPEAALTFEPIEHDAGQDELVAMFREELIDLLAQYEQVLQDWRRDPDQRTAAPALLRILHTLKGSARMAGQVALGEAFHHCEAEVAAIAQLAPSAIRDRLESLQAQLDQWLLDANLPRPAAERVVPKDEVPQHGPSSYENPPHEPHPRRPAAGQLRLRADALDSFADGLATLWLGSTSVADAVQEQRRLANEFGDNLARLRAQLRELEIEAESQIISSAAPANAGDFDPLELDRYTRLHEITRMIAESVADLGDVQRGLAQRTERLSQVAGLQRRELKQLQSALQQVRSQPFSLLQPRLERLLRQAAREAGREAALEIAGGSIAVERTLLDRLAGPLEHLLRNALVHGIEPPDLREAAGKPRSGSICLSVSQTASELQLSMVDDGRGLDLERIHARAAAIGLLPLDRRSFSEDVADPAAIGELIFEPGFSTASEVTALSGRGIGLDAVRSELQALGGSIRVDSRAGQSCCFSIAVPLSLATLPVLLVLCGRHRVAIPTACLQRVLQLKAADIQRGTGAPAVSWQGASLPVQRLAQLLGEPPAADTNSGYLTVALLQQGGRTIALQLDAVEGQQELVVRPLGPPLSRLRWLVGATQLGDGAIALIVDPFSLPVAAGSVAAKPASSDTRPLVLVVDDSLTVRRASQRLLERHGYAVALARDGIEALDWLRDDLPAALLLDIEMPRMDGFELLAAVRDDARLRALPVVMITSRIAERHRERARELGVSGYLGKPFQEDALLALLAQLCTTQHAGEPDPALRPVTGDRDEDRLEEQPPPTRAAPAA